MPGEKIKVSLGKGKFGFIDLDDALNLSDIGDSGTDEEEEIELNQNCILDDPLDFDDTNESVPPSPEDPDELLERMLKEFDQIVAENKLYFSPPKNPPTPDENLIPVEAPKPKRARRCLSQCEKSLSPEPLSGTKFEYLPIILFIFLQYHRRNLGRAKMTSPQ